MDSDSLSFSIDPVQKRPRIIWMGARLTAMSFPFNLSENNNSNREMLKILEQVTGDAVGVEVHLDEILAVHFSSSTVVEGILLPEAEAVVEVGIGAEKGHDRQVAVAAMVMVVEIPEIRETIDHHGVLTIVVVDLGHDLLNVEDHVALLAGVLVVGVLLEVEAHHLGEEDVRLLLLEDVVLAPVLLPAPTLHIHHDHDLVLPGRIQHHPQTEVRAEAKVKVQRKAPHGAKVELPIMKRNGELFDDSLCAYIIVEDVNMYIY